MQRALLGQHIDNPCSEPYGLDGDLLWRDTGARVGQTVTVGPAGLVVHGIEDPMTQPQSNGTVASGSHLVGADIEISNDTDHAITLDFGKLLLLTDASNHHAAPHSVAPTLSAAIAPKTTQRGVVAFAVADQVTTYRLLVKGSLVGGKDVVVPLS